MPRRVLPVLAASLLLTSCGGDEPPPATKPATVRAPATTSVKPARHRDIAGAGVGAREFAAVQRLAGHGLPVYCGAPHGDMVALTFDDGPGPYTHFVLMRLRRNDMRATFFLNSKKFPQFTPWVKRELVRGTVANHTANHVFLPGLAPQAMRREIDSAQDAIAKRAGVPVTLFRPPYGAHNAAIDAHVKARHMLQILWNVDSGDSLGANWRQIRDGVIKRLRPGSIVLMHDNRGQSVRALPDILHAVRRKGLRAVTIPEMIARHPPTLKQLKAGPKGCPGTR